MRSVRYLALRISMGGAIQLSPLASSNLPLESVELDIAPCRDDDRVASGLSLSRAIARRSFPLLTRLTVTANGSGQIVVSTIFCPAQLRELHLDVHYHDDSKASSQLVPTVLAVHLSRNLGLQSLAVRGYMKETPMDVPHPGILVRGTVTAFFLSRLCMSAQLEHIDLADILLSTEDLVMEVINILSDLNNVRYFRFMPRLPTTRRHDWRIPTFDDLQRISSRNTVLSTLEIPVLWDGSLPSASVAPSKHPLRSIALHVYPDVRSVDVLAISRHLHHLFPSLVSLTSGCHPASVEWSVWNLVEELVHTYQDIRAGALAEIQRSASPGRPCSL
ncbi:hypothetical protein NMY22_g14667 [Coprinellus aureogranulatus]|nr:hypothetical protein NMY22_g14667 [Coprinellus aureogranulatus]